MAYLRKDSGIWWIRVAGKRQSSGTTDRAAAEALEQKLNAEAWAQDKMGVRPTRTVAELVAKWKSEKAHKRSKRDDDRICAWWLERLGADRDLRTITRDLVDTVVLRERDGVTPAEPSPANNTANHYVAILAAMLNAAQAEWAWLEGAPKLRRYPVPDGRDRWLTPEEAQGFFAQLPQHLNWPARFALATGLRASKVFELEWSQVDLAARRMTFKGTANKLGNTIPLNDTAMAVLREIREAPVRHMTRVFFYRTPAGDVEPLGWYGDAFEKARARAGLGTDVVWHTFRHSFASWLAQAGVPDPVINRLGGWSTGARSGKTSERYKHLAVDHLRPYAAVIDHALASGTVTMLYFGLPTPTGTTSSTVSARQDGSTQARQN